MTERTAYILRIRQLAVRIAKAQVEATTPADEAAADATAADADQALPKGV